MRDMPFDLCLILVGVGAPISLYTPLADDLILNMPNVPILVLNWWECEDHGKQLIRQATHNHRTLIIAHSAGGVMAMQTLVQYPEFVKRIIMLDTHALKSSSSIPNVEKMLEVILKDSDGVVKEMVINAYQPLFRNHTTFDASLQFAVHWANTELDETRERIKKLSAHTALQIASTNSKYEILNAQEQIEQREVWERYGIDNQFIAMTHFDLVLPIYARKLTAAIIQWLDES